ncbi:MAG: alpha-L-rhamnosidase, partial [Chloroflexota bacterium]|nr:alpha-L-rhamnosidase [Chloroflexota bacterium]
GNAGRPVWIAPQEQGQAPEVLAYRLQFSIAEAATARVHVSADERYELWLDGERIGRGPERGVQGAWFYESYDLLLQPGNHVLVARVWRLGALAPQAQVSTAPGFLLVAQPPFADLLSTGTARWEVRRIAGYTFELPRIAGPAPWFTGANQITDGAAFSWDSETGMGEGWEAVTARREDTRAFLGHVAAHVLRPATLPAQLAANRRAGTVRYAVEHAEPWTDPQSVFVQPDVSDDVMVRTWQESLNGLRPVIVPARRRLQVVLDVEQYVCAYPQLVTSGGRGASITWCWAEALYQEADGRTKGQRDEVEGRFFVALMRDVFRPDGGTGRRFESLWWRAGRFIQLLVETADEPLMIDAISLEETRYPLEMESRIATDDGRLDGIVPLALRALQMCTHETYLDCPYYEQLMFVGDTRLEVLTTYTISRDERLARKALMLFDLSRPSHGLTLAHTPSRDAAVFPPFALWWVAMAHDYALWRDDQPFVARLLPGVRAVLDGFLGMLNQDGLLQAPPGWNFVDWTAGWTLGVPPDGSQGISGLLNWHLVYTLNLAAQLEAWVGEPELARRFERHHRQLADRITPRFWDAGRGLFADDLACAHFSEHTQCLALLSGAVSTERRVRIGQGLLGDPALTRTTIYFTHYLFEAYRLLGRADAVFDRLQLWFDLPVQGFKTTPERPEPTRSDCHGWGAHPLFHGFATILGIRPAAFGFERVEIAPLLGPLQSVSGSLVHPRGMIDVQLETQDGGLRGTIILPSRLAGTLRFGGTTRELAPGRQEVDMV